MFPGAAALEDIACGQEVLPFLIRVPGAQLSAWKYCKTCTPVRKCTHMHNLRNAVFRTRKHMSTRERFFACLLAPGFGSDGAKQCFIEENYENIPIP